MAKFIDQVHGGKVEGGKVQKGVGMREGYKPSAPENLTLPKPTPAPAAPQPSNKK